MPFLLLNKLYYYVRDYVEETFDLLYYKRGEPYLCSAKAPVLDGSGSRR